MQYLSLIQAWLVRTFTEKSEVEQDTPANLRTLRNITLFVYVITIAMGIYTLTQGLFIQAGIVGVLWILLNISGALLLRGNAFPARFFSPLAILIAVSVIAARANGLHDVTIALLIVVIIFGSLTLGVKGALLFAAMTSITTIIMGVLETQGVLVNRFSDLTDGTDIVVIGILTPLVTAVIQITLLNRLNQSILMSQKSNEQQKEINTELIRLQQELEERINERTAELETKSEQLTEQVRTNLRRAKQFQTIADVARYVANIQNLENLFDTVTQLVSEQLGYYHVGIFLNDEANHYTILSAANSEGGKQMLARNHRLKIGETGIVGNVAYTGTTRVALDTGEDAIFFNNPDLPETRSEMAAALKISNQIIGVLDIQSKESNAFSREDGEAFTALADQIAIAIENVRLLENTQKSLGESETIYRQYLRSEWGRIASDEKLSGFQYKITGASPLVEPLHKPEFEQTLESGKVMVHQDENDKSSLVVPIKLRGEILGIVNLRQPGEKAWSKDEIELVQSVTDRLAISAENARLFEETTRRAERERAVSTITTKIRSTNDPQEMMAIALAEIKHALNVRDVRIKQADVAPQSTTDSQAE
jgi:GAF domain-containing protein